VKKKGGEDVGRGKNFSKRSGGPGGSFRPWQSRMRGIAEETKDKTGAS